MICCASRDKCEKIHERTNFFVQSVEIKLRPHGLPVPPLALAKEQLSPLLQCRLIPFR